MGRGYISRKTEEYAINPKLADRVDTTFVAPYGKVTKELNNRLVDETKAFKRSCVDRKVNEEFGWLSGHFPKSDNMGAVTEDKPDNEIIDRANIWQNEKHSRVMHRDFIYPHERRFNGEGWNKDEVTFHAECLEQNNCLKVANRNEALAVIEFGQLSSAIKPLDVYEIKDNPDFETMDFDDNEIISPGECGLMGSVFVSVGKVIKVKEHSVICSPMGDNGERKNLPNYAYSNPALVKSGELVITINGKDFRHIKGDLLPEHISFAIAKRLVHEGYTLERAADIIIERYY